jgi:hypothetical protein
MALIASTASVETENISIITAHYSQSKARPCYVNINGQKLVIESVKRYKRKMLVEYEGCGSEGLYVARFKSHADYWKELLPYKKLQLERDRNIITYFTKRYEITTAKSDSLFIETSKGNYLIIVGHI